MFFLQTCFFGWEKILLVYCGWSFLLPVKRRGEVFETLETLDVLRTLEKPKHLVEIR